MRSTENRKMLIGCDGNSPQAARTKQSMVTHWQKEWKIGKWWKVVVHWSTGTMVVVQLVHWCMGTWVHRCGTWVHCTWPSTMVIGSSGDVVLFAIWCYCYSRNPFNEESQPPRLIMDAAFCGIFQHFPNLQPTYMGELRVLPVGTIFVEYLVDFCRIPRRYLELWY